MSAAAVAGAAGAARVLQSRIGVMTYLAPTGPLDEQAMRAALEAAVDECIARGETQLILDLSSVPRVSSAALEAVLAAQDRLLRLGGWLRLVHAGELVREVLRITGLDQRIEQLQPDGRAAPPPAPAPAPAGERSRLGDLLVQKGLITAAQAEEALRLQGREGRRMGRILVERGWVEEPALLAVLGEQLGLPVVRLRAGLYDPAVVALLPREVAQRLKVLPLFLVQGELSLATADPLAVPSFDEVAERLGCRVRPVLATEQEILDHGLAAGEDDSLAAELGVALEEDLTVLESLQPDDYAAIDEMASGSPVVKMVNTIIQRAVHDGASDVHIEPSRTRSRVRFRIDGVLYEVMTPPIELHPAIVSRLKVMANLDIAERRLPQDGRIQVQTQGRAVDLRFSSLPGLFGEKVVLRVLDRNQAILDLERLGMQAHNLARFRGLLRRSHGLILVTGPTGSGKTTSLYAAINHLNSIEKNIVTIEDPVEYQVDIVNQNQVREGIGLTFARLLKHVLRQDPDVIMVGEIRECETAEIAVQAALTGHLVLSTLHTSDSAGAVARLIDMGVEPYLLSSALIGVVAQRLVRTVCPDCKTGYVAPPEIVQRYGWQDEQPVRLVRGRGCPACYDSGYRGRIGLHEVLESDGALQQLILRSPTRDELDEHLRRHGVPTLFDDGLARVREGLTTLEEVGRAVSG